MLDLEEHARRIMEAVAEFERLEDAPLRDRVFALLEDIDHLHRSCVWRLFELLTDLGGKGLVDRLVQDPHVKTLFVLYDLISADPLSPVEAHVMPPAAAGSGFIPLVSIGGRQPAWRVGFARQDLPPGTMKPIQVDGMPIVICAIDDEVFAYRNGCGRGNLPLHLGLLASGEIACPWHGCRFEGRTGKRLAGVGPDLQMFRVSIREDTVYVATNVPPAPMETRAGSMDDQTRAAEGGEAR
jgi:nitrite reductase/ring-hydroxylating ferredoxin subunit